MIEVVSGHKNAFGISELMRNIDTCNAWMIFRNLEQIPAYKAIMEEVLEALIGELDLTNGYCLRPMCFAFVSSPFVRVPLHIDPEHNFLFQVFGSKSVYINHHGEDPILSPTQIAGFYADEVGFSLSGTPVREENFQKFHLTPSGGVYVPVTYPHFVTNDTSVSISFSVTFRSVCSDAHRMRHLKMLQSAL